MLKLTRTYEDFDGNERTEDFYFGLMPSELLELQNSMNGGLSQLLEKLINEKDIKQIIEYFKKIVLASYGVKSLDGRNFYKDEQIRKEFISTTAYSDIFMDLATDSDAAAKFVKGILPSEEAMKKYKEKLEANNKAVAAKENSDIKVVEIENK